MSKELPTVSDATVINGRVFLQAQGRSRNPCRYTGSEQVNKLVSNMVTGSSNHCVKQELNMKI